eukprot:329569-Chlamydomonas_euryale.AAC.9
MGVGWHCRSVEHLTPIAQPFRQHCPELPRGALCVRRRYRVKLCGCNDWVGEGSVANLAAPRSLCHAHPGERGGGRRRGGDVRHWQGFSAHGAWRPGLAAPLSPPRRVRQASCTH